MADTILKHEWTRACNGCQQYERVPGSSEVIVEEDLEKVFLTYQCGSCKGKVKVVFALERVEVTDENGLTVTEDADGIISGEEENKKSKPYS